MSKMDAMRAMREARFAQRQARPAQVRPAQAPPVQAPPAQRPVVPRVVEAATAPEPEALEPDALAPETAPGGLCGHRSMNGRTCTREQGHSAKSHRYS